ncbi:Gag-Pol polyprotein, partial [Mucuna pruriens]
MWGIDILGLFPLAPGQVKFLMVVVDCFTKWIEVEPIALISAKRVRHFYWKKIICRFGLSTVIATDNGTQFIAWAITEFCAQYGIKQSFTLVEHHHSNGQAEATNRVILKGLCKRLKEVKGRWVEELSLVLWSLFQSDNNEVELRENLDLLLEEREMTHIRECATKARVAKRYNATVFPCPIRKDDLVLRRTLMGVDTNKLTPKWEGPFRVREEVGQGSFKLEHLNEKVVPRTWNSITTRKYYS